MVGIYISYTQEIAQTNILAFLLLQRYNKKCTYASEASNIFKMIDKVYPIQSLAFTQACLWGPRKFLICGESGGIERFQLAERVLCASIAEREV